MSVTPFARPPRTLGQRRPLLVTACATVALLTSTSAFAGAAGVVPPSNPRTNLWPVPAYSFTGASQTYAEGQTLPACWAWGGSASFVAQGTTPACVAAEVAATDRAHRVEGLPTVTLPTNFRRLSVPDQLLVLVDIERVSRGEAPVLGVVNRANAFAQVAAGGNRDPSLPPNSGIAGATGDWASNYAGGVNTLDANYAWMYADGWDGALTFNYACTGPGAPGCWGHRDNILTNASRMPCSSSSCSLVMGGGYVSRGAGHGYSSFTELFVQVAGVVPALSFTWRAALAAGARA